MIMNGFIVHTTKRRGHVPDHKQTKEYELIFSQFSIV